MSPSGTARIYHVIDNPSGQYTPRYRVRFSLQQSYGSMRPQHGYVFGIQQFRIFSNVQFILNVRVRQ